MSIFSKWWKPDPEDKERLARAKKSNQELDELHKELIDIHGQAKVIGQSLKQSRQDNNYGLAVRASMTPKKRK